MNEERAKRQAILDALITTLRDGRARELVTPTHTTVRGHVVTVTDEVVRRMGGNASRADVLETWLMMHLTVALKEQGEAGEPVQAPMGDA